MKYLLMIVMFCSCILVCYFINKSKRDRAQILIELRNSTRACDMSQYFLSMSSTANDMMRKLKNIVSDMTLQSATVVDTQAKLLSAMPNIFNKSTDPEFLMNYLCTVIDTANTKSKETLALRCEKMINSNKDEIRTNMYISVAMGIVLIILVI